MTEKLCFVVFPGQGVHIVLVLVHRCCHFLISAITQILFDRSFSEFADTLCGKVLKLIKSETKYLKTEEMLYRCSKGKYDCR